MGNTKPKQHIHEECVKEIIKVALTEPLKLIYNTVAM